MKVIIPFYLRDDIDMAA